MRGEMARGLTRTNADFRGDESVEFCKEKTWHGLHGFARILNGEVGG